MLRAEAEGKESDHKTPTRSIFSPVPARTRVTKDPCSKDAGLAMGFTS